MRWLVVFQSEASKSGAVDASFYDVRAASHLAAISSIVRSDPPQHPWSVAAGVPWPKGARTIDAAMRAIA